MFISLLEDGGFGIAGVAMPGDQGLTATARARKQRLGMVAVPNACRTGEELKA